jgi:sugar O-acyltransferase (sialic acid O-acetyltransferase NeuD family)
VEINKIIFQGGGEHARVVLDCLLSQGQSVEALFDPKYSGDLFGVPQRGAYDPTFMPEAKAIVAIGDNRIRKVVAEKTQHAFINVIHPGTMVSQRIDMGLGNMILQGVIVQAQCKIGNHCILNTGSQVDHDCQINDYVHIGPGAILCGTVTVGEGAFVGAGAVITPGKKIGKWAVVGAGAVVIRDVPDGAVVAGNPAKIIRQIA